jgi:hypothetical protein
LEFCLYDPAFVEKALQPSVVERDFPKPSWVVSVSSSYSNQLPLVFPLHWPMIHALSASRYQWLRDRQEYRLVSLFSLPQQRLNQM